MRDVNTLKAYFQDTTFSCSPASLAAYYSASCAGSFSLTWPLKVGVSQFSALDLRPLLPTLISFMISTSLMVLTLSDQWKAPSVYTCTPGIDSSLICAVISCVLVGCLTSIPNLTCSELNLCFAILPWHAFSPCCLHPSQSTTTPSFPQLRPDISEST